MGKKEYMLLKEGLCDGFDVAITCEVCKWCSQWGKITEPPFVRSSWKSCNGRMFSVVFL